MATTGYFIFIAGTGSLYVHTRDEHEPPPERGEIVTVRGHDRRVEITGISQDTPTTYFGVWVR